ncbi:MAG TPA: aminotransferase class V-fold PLP-dependent enzyme [Gemmatimonadaceae bacterium]|nr:aminotransferase class V-fold PLP-dependent enzyme [Gemmatimonadaceae bacterium]
MTDALLSYRSEFPILSTSNYLVSHSLGAMPRLASERLAEYGSAWAARGVHAWEDRWWEMPIAVGDEVAPLIGAGAGEVAMVPNVTIGQAGILSSLDYRAPRDTIVMTGLDFPSVRYVYDGLAKRLGARIVVVESRDGISISEDEVIAAIDERTRLVCVSEVFFRSAFILDVARIVRHAHSVGALVACDSYHAVGAIPVDVKASGVDWLTGGVLKWLCGGPGGAFVYASPSLPDSVRPAFTGWQAHEEPFAFAPSMLHNRGGWRWLTGTPPIPALYAALEGPRIIRRAGIEAIRAKSQRQTAHLVALADARGWKVNAPRDANRRAGTVAIDIPDGKAISRALGARRIEVDYRPGAGVRVAPHFYNTDQELDDVVAAIDDIIATGAWKEFAASRAVVT